MTETGRNKLAKWFKIVALSLAGALFLLHVFIFVLFNIVEKLKQDYLYLTVYDSEVFIITILITLVLPALVGLGCCFSLKIRRWPIKIFLVIVSLVLLVGMLFSSFFVQLGGGGIASYTEKMDDYGRYDSLVCRAVEACSLEGFFPDKEDLKESSQYRYLYDYGSIDELYYIQLDAHFTAEKYAAEKARLEHQYTEMVSFSEETLYQHFHKIPGGVVTAAVCMDDAENRILYKVFRSENESLANDGIVELAGLLNT